MNEIKKADLETSLEEASKGLKKELGEKVEEIQELEGVDGCTILIAVETDFPEVREAYPEEELPQLNLCGIDNMSPTSALNNILGCTKSAVREVVRESMEDDPAVKMFVAKGLMELAKDIADSANPDEA